MDIMNSIQNLDVIQLMIGGCIGFILTKLLELIWDRLINKFKRINIRKKIEKSDEILNEECNIVSLDHADPTYELYDIEIIETGGAL